jgi:ectoine hydroxylase-related dioxygenase (phytanoyl-CoA dioxygenase family)
LFPYFYLKSIRRFIRRSSLVKVVAHILKAKKLKLFFDQLIVRKIGSSKITQIHQDLPFWPIAGVHTCGVWIPLTPIERDSGPLSYVLGSHISTELFSNYPPHGLPYRSKDDFPLAKSFCDMSPGDFLAHHPRTAHWSDACSTTSGRAVYIAAFAGEKEIFHSRAAAMRFPIPLGLGNGDRLEGALFPDVYCI